MKNLENSKKLVEEFKREYREVQRLYKLKPKNSKQLRFKNFKRKELLKRYMAKLLNNKKFKKKYLKKLKRNQRY